MKVNVDYFPARTSINRVAYGLKYLAKHYPDCRRNLDYGGGKYDVGTHYLLVQGVFNFIYDPYNRPDHVNDLFLELSPFDSVTLLNVLNVIPDKKERIGVIWDAYSQLKEGGVFIISIYAGNKSGKGSISKTKTYQHNQPLAYYIKEVKAALGDVAIKIHKNLIIIKK